MGLINVIQLHHLQQCLWAKNHSLNNTAVKILATLLSEQLINTVTHEDGLTDGLKWVHVPFYSNG